MATRRMSVITGYNWKGPKASPDELYKLDVLLTEIKGHDWTTLPSAGAAVRTY